MFEMNLKNPPIYKTKLKPFSNLVLSKFFRATISDSIYKVMKLTGAGSECRNDSAKLLTCKPHYTSV